MDHRLDPLPQRVLLADSSDERFREMAVGVDETGSDDVVWPAARSSRLDTERIDRPTNRRRRSTRRRSSPRRRRSQLDLLRSGREHHESRCPSNSELSSPPSRVSGRSIERSTTSLGPVPEQERKDTLHNSGGSNCALVESRVNTCPAAHYGLASLCHSATYTGHTVLSQLRAAAGEIGTDKETLDDNRRT